MITLSRCFSKRRRATPTVMAQIGATCTLSYHRNAASIHSMWQSLLRVGPVSILRTTYASVSELSSYGCIWNL